MNDANEAVQFEGQGVQPHVLTPQQVAERLQLPLTWVYENTRSRAGVRCPDPIPHLKLGRYLRFRWADVEEWLNRQNRTAAQLVHRRA